MNVPRSATRFVKRWLPSQSVEVLGRYWQTCGTRRWERTDKLVVWREFELPSFGAPQPKTARRIVRSFAPPAPLTVGVSAGQFCGVERTNKLIAPVLTKLVCSLARRGGPDGEAFHSSNITPTTVLADV
jgi:hypothetical protein